MRSADAGPAAPGRAAPPDCFHCGLPVPSGTAFRFDTAKGPRHFCCAGCEAVSGAIGGLGLDDYYRLRTKPAPRADARAGELAEFDQPAVADRFVSAVGNGLVEAELVVEGLRCAACAWLVEQALLREPGVVSAQVVFATRRARVRWESAAAPPSAILQATARVGYSAWPYDARRVALVEADERRALLRRLWVAGLCMMQAMMYAVPTYIAGEGEIGLDAASLMRWAGLVLTLPVMLYSAGPIFNGAWRSLRTRHLGMDVPVALGLAVAFAGSAWATFAGAGDVYFDSVTMFVFLLLGARYLELVARARAGRSLLDLARLVPQFARRLRHPSGLEADSVPVASLAPGDRVLVLPGETVPADGELASPQATLDEAWMTGESRPVAHRAGDAILGGAVNAGSAISMRVLRVGEATAISAIHRLMQRAFSERPGSVASAERAVPLFVAGVLVAAAAGFAAWLAIDPARAPWIAVAVLIATCPCALALAAPAALTAAAGALARSRVVVTRLAAIESLARVTDVVFDKTGTLTTGRLALADAFPLDGGDTGPAVALAAALACASSHPLDRAIAEAARGTVVPGATGHTSVPGQGVEAVVAGRRVRLGRAEYAAALHGKPLPLAFIGETDPVAWLADEEGWRAAFRFTDAARADTGSAVEALRVLGLRVHLLSGDRHGIVMRLAADSGIDHWQSDAEPAHKREFVRSLQHAGARVAMVGDGMNDAPVLAQADVSIAMGCGADAARVSADFVLLADAPSEVARTIALARKARRIVRQNLGWALGYNAIVIPLALAGLLTPLAAGIGMSASSLLVVANALRVRG